MRVVDSSDWVDWLTERPVAELIKHEIPPKEDCIIPTIVQLELSKWLGRERDEDAVDSFMAYTMKCGPA